MAHWKTLFDYEFLGSHDLPQNDSGQVQDLTVGILSIERREITGKGGKKAMKPVANLAGAKKPIILNKTNLDHLAKIFGTTEYQEYIGKTITLYTTKVKNPEGKGEVDGLRIREVAPEQIKLPEMNPENSRWADAKKAFKAGNLTLDQIKSKYILTVENERKLNED